MLIMKNSILIFSIEILLQSALFVNMHAAKKRQILFIEKTCSFNGDLERDSD